jgi:DNA end-binding protein Ku
VSWVNSVRVIALVPRAHWKGFLKLSLVSCPIALYPAVAKNERISFRQVNKQTGNRLRQQLVDTITGEPVARDQKGRGYEVGADQFLLVREDEIAAAEEEARHRPYTEIGASTVSHPVQGSEAPNTNAQERTALSKTELSSAKATSTGPDPVLVPRLIESNRAIDMVPRPIENNRTIEIDRFIPRAQVDPRYLDTPYYAVPRDEIGEEAFAVIRDAMRTKDVVGMGRIVLARRERPIILEPMGDGIRGITLRYRHEIRDEASYFAAIPKLKLPQELLRVAEHIVKVKISDFDPAFLEDRYRTVLISKLKQKHSELSKKGPARPPPENVINLMDILKRSLAVERPTVRSRSPSASAPRMHAAPKSASSKRARIRKAV